MLCYDVYMMKCYVKSIELYIRSPKLCVYSMMCNDPDPPLADIILFGLSLSGFKTCVLGEGFVLLPNQCGTSQSTSLQGPASLLAHRLVSTPLRVTARRPTHRLVTGSDTICNDPNPPLADIVLFGLSLSGFPSRL